MEKGQRQGARSKDGLILEPLTQYRSSVSNVPDLLGGIT